MRQQRSCLWVASLAAWQALLLVAAVLLSPASAAKYEAPGETVQGPDPATMFEVQGRIFWNKSLGLDQQAPGVLGHQCSAARPSPHPTEHLTYTPNRRCAHLQPCLTMIACEWKLQNASSIRDMYVVLRPVPARLRTASTGGDSVPSSPQLPHHLSSSIFDPS